MFQVTFWMNIASHYQRDFFQELNTRKEIKLNVCYFEHIDANRKKLGWEDETLKNYEFYVEKASDIYSFKNYRENLHVILGNSYLFNKDLLRIVQKEKLKWCHWSEPYGINCWEKAHFHSWLANLFLQIMYWKKRSYGRLIANSALFAMGQGITAKKNFMKWGVPEYKIRMLYYCGNKRIITDLTIKDKLNFKDKRVFLNLGQLTLLHV